jgi:hypothetical protein
VWRVIVPVPDGDRWTITTCFSRDPTC